MPMYGRRPLTRLETGLYAIIIGVVILFLLDRLLDVMELAERSAMERNVLQINTVLTEQIASEMLKRQLIYVDVALKKNPLELARRFPPNYRGEGDAFQLARVED